MSGLNPRISRNAPARCRCGRSVLARPLARVAQIPGWRDPGQSLPVFERLAVVIETARADHQEAKARMASNMEAAQTKLSPT
jgi:hypothetical protein